MSATLRAYAIPITLLGVMFVLLATSAWNDSAIIDELAHMPAAYAYLFLQDYRLNPEHPPLIKMLAALPLVFSDVNFPTNTKAWREDINGQWEQGRIFLYESGNDAERILFLMRLPVMALAVLLGWLLWVWTRRHLGRRAAALTLFFYALSPTFLAHSRYVTTDLAAAFGFFIGVVTFLRFLAAPTRRNVVIAGLALGIAQLLKFSLILLLPVYAVLLVVWAASRTEFGVPRRLLHLGELAAKSLAAGGVAIVLVWAAYAYAVANYPAERQYRDAEFILTSFGNRTLANADLWLIGHDVTRPLGQYLLGLLMVLQRSAGGNTQYFLGEVSAVGDVRYFPALYLFKETAAFHILTLGALALAARAVLAAPEKSLAAALAWTRRRFPEFASLAFIAVYWAVSLSSTLNIGVRHVLPTFPFIYLLTARQITQWLRPPEAKAVSGFWGALARLWRAYVAPLPGYLIVAGLLVWVAVSVIGTFPHYLSYYNFLGGTTDGGWRIGVDSNYDWGQDLRRLADFVGREGIAKIRVDYFGGGSPGYYLGEKFTPWWSAKGYPPGGGWYAVSATFQMGAVGEPAEGFIRKPEDSYEWLKPFRPVARAGKSIFIYRLPEQPPPGL